MRSCTLKESHIGSSVGEILWIRQTDSDPVTFILQGLDTAPPPLEVKHSKNYPLSYFSIYFNDKGVEGGGVLTSTLRESNFFIMRTFPYFLQLIRGFLSYNVFHSCRVHIFSYVNRHNLLARVVQSRGYFFQNQPL